MDLAIRDMESADWPAVSEIYREGIDTAQATFETAVPAYEEWDQAHLARPRVVAIEGRVVLGWAALSPVSRRAVYAGVAEVSVYVGTVFRSRGVGQTLLRVLVDKSEEAGIWTLQAGIFTVNRASRLLHRRSGFREVGIRERIGQLHGVWHDVVLMERRSARVGA
jgi:phosphinothricin acetyltransferase